MKLLYAMITASVTFLAFTVEAKEVRYKDYQLELKDVERIVFYVPRGSLKLQTTPASSSGTTAILKARKKLADRVSDEEAARFEAVSFSARRQGATLFVEMKLPEEKSEWVRNRDGVGTEMHFEFEGPSIQTQATVRFGQIIVQSWNRELSATLVDGSLTASSGEGPLNIQIQRGEVRINRHQGNVDIDSYGAKVTIGDLTGNLELSNFAGESSLSSVKGNLNLLSNSGATTLGRSSGFVDFSLGRGALTLSDFSGAVKGATDMGPVIASITGSEIDVQVESSQAPVTVRLPSDSGANLSLSTDEGFLHLPSQIRQPMATVRQYKGRLKGAGAKGIVSVKTKSGAVRIQL